MKLIAIIAAALALTASAAAAPPDLSALGYSVSLVNDASTGCTSYHVTGYGADVTFTTYGYQCKETANMEAAMHSFAAGHDERKLGFEHPAAVAARSTLTGKGYAVATSYAGPSFGVTGGCQGSSTVDAAGLVSLAGSLPAAAEPCPPPPVAEQPPPSTEPPPPSTEDRVGVLEQLVNALQEKVASLQTAIEASWDALVKAYSDGLPSDEAALAARSAAMNALYGLGG